jgi:glycosyltransferase involved in cell wall biosynthesis
MSTSLNRVAIFGPSLRQGGAEVVMVTLAREIAERGFHVDLIAATLEGPHLAEVPPSVRVVDLKASRVLASLPGLTRYLRTERPEALLSVMNHANIVALWARLLAGVPTRVVVSEHNTLSSSTHRSSSLQDRMMPWLIRCFYPWAEGIIAVSRGVAEDLAVAAHLPRQRIHVIYNPIVRPELIERAEAPLDHPWFEPGQPPVFIGIGRLREQKDFPTLIKAFAQVRRERPCRLLIFGEGPDRPEIEALVRRLGLENDIALPGYDTNPYAYLRCAAAFVLSSRWEGLPTVLIEALVCGVPVISTDCPSGPREILEGGRYGQLVPVGDAPALAHAMASALAGSADRPPRESWRAFELEGIVNQYLNSLSGNPSCVQFVTGYHSA